MLRDEQSKIFVQFDAFANIQPEDSRGYPLPSNTGTVFSTTLQTNT